MKSEFVEMVSHELRSPLSSVWQQTSLITDRLVGEINEKQHELLNRVIARLDGLLLMINKLLDLSRIEAGGLIQQIEKIFLLEII